MSLDIAKCSFRRKNYPCLRTTDLDGNSRGEKKSKVINNTVQKDSQLKQSTIFKKIYQQQQKDICLYESCLGKTISRNSQVDNIVST